MMFYAEIEIVYQIYYFYLCFIVSIVIGLLSYIVSARVIECDLGSAYECGFEPFEESHRPYSVTFYLIGLLFVLFDIEILLLLPWCIAASMHLWNGWLLVLVFFQLLLLGFMFEWLRGAITISLR